MRQKHLKEEGARSVRVHSSVASSVARAHGATHLKSLVFPPFFLPLSVSWRSRDTLVVGRSAVSAPAVC